MPLTVDFDETANKVTFRWLHPTCRRDTLELGFDPRCVNAEFFGAIECWLVDHRTVERQYRGDTGDLKLRQCTACPIDCLLTCITRNDQLSHQGVVETWNH
ncbi:hypothetical protein D3C86_1624870 [compost metagenome]